MKSSLVFVCALVLTALAPVPSRAQYLAPALARQLDAEHQAAVSAPPALSTTSDMQEPKRWTDGALQTAVGGFVGGTVGTLVGMAVGAQRAHGCQGDFCGVGAIVLGMSLGESIGLATGANIASRSHRPERIVLTSLTSAAILVGGAYASAGLSRGNGNAGRIMIPLIPALQLAAAVAIESH